LAVELAEAAVIVGTSTAAALGITITDEIARPPASMPTDVPQPALARSSLRSSGVRFAESTLRAMDVALPWCRTTCP